MNKRIYLCLAHMSEDGMEQKYIKEAFDTNWVVPLGPNVNGFEKDLEDFVGEGKRVVALSAGTAAVHLALLNCGVKPGDEVIVQSFTFCASSHPITYLGAIPVFVDSEKDSWNMDPELMEEAIKDRIAKTGKKPKAIVPGAVGGAAGVIHAATSAHTDCEPNSNVEALRVLMDQAQIEARPLHHHRQRHRIRRTQIHRQEAPYKGLFRTPLLLLGERSHRKHQQTRTAVHT